VVVALIRTIAVLAAILLALGFYQIYLLESFRSGLPGNAGQRQEEVGWCMLFACEKISYPTRAIISNQSLDLGFDVSPKHLNFGQIPAGGGGKRELGLEGLRHPAADV